ncbi:MAG: potassium/proton antiporter [Planctomycetia bacterium]|uniref:K+/H+ antiporter n=1 Tax=Candidatus Brocadia sapporoensis TaxID=392547 RepID=A0A1V6LZL7_9BACT|nr:potassium/proton antiporter [Candidatus Brocadia sapporoensis]MCC7239073.1 potassium/proton antiporter [Candidatus Brocadia sp.]QOJ07345.1 MAG: potassium/proton antiporter [Planctomycetia bacterium]TVL98236.1 MAG: potassium/proton antiporter [Candidatus Brocadia sp. BL1]MDG6005265.1 potassium/proton antiporter [Candidatus Brocadia sp.]OQD45583.1 K+/H+ antiporter [Candidatus Brocadia sapporoensis]
MTIENILLLIAVLIFVSVISSKLSDKFGIPILLLFLTIGMLAGSEGIGGIYFDNAQLAKSIGVVALIFIIFSGGFDTKWKDTKSVILPGAVLSTAGVLMTAIFTGLFAVYILKFSLMEGMLLGSIVSSTDAPAVFSILRSKRISLKPPLKPLLEFESGSNDPMAIFLTIGFISVLTVKNVGVIALIPKFMLDMSVGALIGYFMSKFILFFIIRLKLGYEGLYPVMMISFVLLTYVIAFFLNGNGILAVYVAGLMLGKSEFPNKKMIIRFHDGLAWLAQIVMFVTLGLLVFPSHIAPLIGAGFLLTFLLMVIARPVSVLLCLLPFKMDMRKKVMVAWVGLRGSVPIILATFPFVAGIPQADTIFNIVFFVVIMSVFIQGTSIPILSKILKLGVPLANQTNYPIEFEKTAALDAEMIDVIVPFDSEVVGKMIGDLDIPEKCLIMLIGRGGKFVIPSGDIIIESGDVLLVLANKADFLAFQQTLSRLKKE